MNEAIILALCSIVTGGGLTALLTAIFNRAKQKDDARHKDIDDRIMAWQQIADHNETRFNELEKRLAEYEKYIIELERIIIKLNPNIELPNRLNYGRLFEND